MFAKELLIPDFLLQFFFKNGRSEFPKWHIVLIVSNLLHYTYTIITCHTNYNCVVSGSTSHAVGHWFAPRESYTEDHHKNGTNCLPVWVSGLEFGSATQLCSVWNGLYKDMHYKDLLGSIARVGYCIPVPDFYLVLHGFRC